MAAAAMIATAEAPKRPSSAKRMEVRPAHNPSIVSRLGIIRLKDGPLYRGRLRRLR